MLHTVSDLKTDVAAILTGIDLDQVNDPEGSFERAVATLIQKADVPEASGREPIMLYNGVTEYAAPETMFASALIDIRPQGVNRNRFDDVEKMGIARWDKTKCITPSGYRVAFESRKNMHIMRIAQGYATPAANIDSMSDTDGWTLAGDGSGLALDRTVYYQEPASLRFNLTTAGAQATLTKTLDNTLDLSDYEGVGVVFLAIYMPNQTGDTTPIQSVTLRLGSSAADYVEKTSTEGFIGPFFADDFFLVPFDLAGLANNGTPDFSAIDYVQIAVNFNGTAVANVRCGGLFASLPSPHEVLFYSPAVFRNTTTGAISEEIGDDADEILFRDAAYNIYVQEAAREVAKNQGGDISSGTIAAIDLVLEGGGEKLGLYQQFRGDNPSEELRQVNNYYYD